MGRMLDIILVSLTGRLDEMRALIASAGYRIVREVVQKRPMDPKSFVGKGKLQELQDLVKELHPGAVVFHGEVRPSQHYHLEKELGAQVFDRTRVILEIFVSRAHSREAQLQVELAMLQYEVPILKEWIHHGVVGERPGFMAGGEYRVDAYLETVKRRIKKIRDELEGIRRERGRRRAYRQERGFYLVSLAGHANAGKSSLLNALTGAHVLVEARMFSTLSTTTRALHGVRRRVLLTDTVGFIDEVPLWLIQAFNATLEEIYEADLILLVLDGSESDEEFLRKLRLAARTLLPRTSPADVLPVITKADLMDDDAVMRKTFHVESSEFGRSPLVASALSEEGVAGLREGVLGVFRLSVLLDVHLTGADAEATLSWLHERMEVETVRHTDRGIQVRLRCRPEDIGRIQDRASALEIVADVT